MADGGTQPGVGPGHAAASRCSTGVEAVVEPLHRHHVHGGPALRTEGVERHPIAQIVKSPDEAAAAAR